MRGANAKYYEGHWQTLVELSSPEWQSRIGNAALRVERGRQRYTVVERTEFVPWQIIGAIHQMESGGDFGGCLANGQDWRQKTTIEPVGAGPWRSWEDSAVWALDRDGLSGCRDWNIAAVGMALEKFNGGPKWRTRGYAKRGVNSPYLWSGSNHGVGVGKYFADGRYDPDAVSGQVGAMVILRRMESMGLYRPGAPAPAVAPNGFVLAYNPRVAVDVVANIQGEINRLAVRIGGRLAYLAAIPLVVDGILGPQTAKAIRCAGGDWPAGTPENIKRTVDALAVAMGV